MRNLIAVAVFAVLCAALFALFAVSCSNGGKSSLTGASASLGGMKGDNHAVTDGNDYADTEASSGFNAEQGLKQTPDRTSHPRVDALDTTDGVSLETDAGAFTLFVVDNNNVPNRDAADAYEMSWDEISGKLTVGAAGGIPTYEDEHPDDTPASLYFVLYYDNTGLTPTGTEYGGLLGEVDDVLTLAMTNEPGHLEYGMARIADGNASQTRASAFSVVFASSPFLASRTTSSAEEMRRTMAPVDFAPQDNPDGSFILEWTERNVGDYDGNGEVGIADITPIAQYYLLTVAEAETALEQELYEQIDGDRSGDIGISDITPIANNYLNSTEGYDLWRISDANPEPEWLPNLDNPDLFNADTASAPRPDPITMPPEREGLAVRYNYASGGSQTSALRGKSRTVSASQPVLYAIARQEPGEDTAPSGILMDTQLAPTGVDSMDVNLSIQVLGEVARPFTLWIAWDMGLRPEIHENYLADGTDNVISHTYDSGGQFNPTINLIASDGYTYAASLAPVDINGPQASLTVDQDTGFAPLSVVFDASGSQPGGAPISRFEWDYEGDGIYDEDTGLTAVVNHTYTEDGIFEATVRVWDEQGAGATSSTTITVFASAVASLTADPTSGNPPLVVSFDASGSTSPNGAIVQYEWDWDGDAVYDDTSGAVPTIQHTYNEGGVFNATVRITDEIDAQGTDSVEIIVANKPPSAVLNADYYKGDAPLTVNFDASGSTDLDGDIIRFEWDLDADGTFEYNSGIDPAAHYTYDNTGSYSVSVKVTDDDEDSSTDTVIIKVVISPIAQANADPTSGNYPLLVHFDAEGSYDPDGSITRYIWDFDGDGFYDYSSDESGTVDHTYTSGGYYDALLRVLDNDNASDTDTVLIHVNTEPNVDLQANPTSGLPPFTVHFDASNSDDPDGIIVKYEWDWTNDGIFDLDTGSDPFADHEYTIDGTYYAVCSATDELGATGTDSIKIVVNNFPPVAVANADVTTGNIPLVVNFDADGSSDVDGTIVLYEWDFDGDGSYEWSSPTDGDAQYTYTGRGDFLAELRVTDDDDATDTDTVLIHIFSWHFETVDPDCQDNTSLALDSNDRPHISYFPSFLAHSFFDGISWIKETVDDVGTTGWQSSIAVDSSDNIHISYHNVTGEDLKYAYFDGATWTKTTVDSAGLTGMSTSIALDSNGHPHIAYLYLHPVPEGMGTRYDGRLKYATYNGSSWSVTTVDSTGSTGFDPSIAIDSSDQPRISYQYMTTDGSVANLKYASYNGATWSTQIVDSNGRVGSYTSLAFDSNDYPHISYHASENFTLKHAFNDGSGWAIETVDTDSMTGQYTSIAIDSNDLPHISYYNASNADLMYAFNDGSNWSIEIVDEFGLSGWHTSLELSADDLPRVSYFRNGALGYCWLG